METSSQDGRAVVVAALAEPAHRLLKEALGRLIAAEAMLEAMTGGVAPDDLTATPMTESTCQ